MTIDDWKGGIGLSLCYAGVGGRRMVFAFYETISPMQKGLDWGGVQFRVVGMDESQEQTGRDAVTAGLFRRMFAAVPDDNDVFLR